MAALVLLGCTPDEPDPGEVSAIASEALVWGYPLVVSERTMQTLGGVIGVNTLFNQAALLGAGATIIVSPNQDTLYSVAVLDLRSEPVVLTIPDVTDRYWTYQFLDAWTNSFHYIGTRATQGQGGTFVIAPSGWEGELPANATLIASPTPQVFLLGRYLVRDEADIANVTALERTLHTLTNAPPPPPLGDPLGAPSETARDGGTFFDELGDALALNPPATDADRAALERFAAIGIGPGLHPFANSDDPTALVSGAVQGLARIDEAARAEEQRVNGWTAHLDIEAFESDPLMRAVIAKTVWGANVPAEAVYARSLVDAAGSPYTGNTPYIVHFDAAELPPVDATHGFWSLTLYGPDNFFVENAIDRYAIGDRTPGLVYAADGSLDLFIENSAPQGMESNWLPAPTGEFQLMLRLYLPSETVLSGAYTYPPVVVR